MLPVAWLKELRMKPLKSWISLLGKWLIALVVVGTAYGIKFYFYPDALVMNGLRLESVI